MANKTANSVLPIIAACFCFIYSPLASNAQNQKKIDSLKHVIAVTQSDSVTIKAINSIAELTQDRKELTACFKQMIILGKKMNDPASLCLAYSQLGYYKYEEKDYAAAENLFKEGMSIAEKTGNDFAYGRMCNTMMCIYDKRGDMPTAINYLKQGEQLLIKANRMKNLTRLYCNASAVYANHNLLDKAHDYARKAYASAEAARSGGDMEPMTTASWYLASSLLSIAKYDSASYYFLQGLAIAEKLELVYTQGDMLRGLSNVYAELKAYPKAKEYLNKAVLMYDSAHVPDRVTDCEESLAYLDFMQKNFSKVKAYVLSRGKKITGDSLQNNRYVNKWLANVALAENNMEGWKIYAKKYEQADAALTNEKIQKNILELETKYNLSKKESELLQKETENRKRLWIIGALCFCLLSLGVIALMQNRNNRNKRRIAEQYSIIEKQNALAEERLRIAADMHDDVGAGLSRIRYITSSLKDGKSLSVGDMDKILSLSDESVEKMNEIIWALNQGNQQLDELIYYTRSQCSEMLSNAGISFTFDLPENIPTLTLGWKECRNIYLLVKEAVNNAIKHSGAKNIAINFSFNPALKISVKDDGKGFDENTRGRHGNGLMNYKKRSEALGGVYTIISSVNDGTELNFTIPILAT